MKNSNPICIRINNRAEKLAALHLMSEALGLPINPHNLSQTLNNFQVLEYNYVGELDGEIVSYAYECAEVLEYDHVLTPETIRYHLTRRTIQLSDGTNAQINTKTNTVKIGAYKLNRADMVALFYALKPE